MESFIDECVAEMRRVALAAGCAEAERTYRDDPAVLARAPGRRRGR